MSYLGAEIAENFPNDDRGLNLIASKNSVFQIFNFSNACCIHLKLWHNIVFPIYFPDLTLCRANKS